jgi:competence protein ComEC
LGFAAFILLLYNPNFLFDVGFRLSFAAVFGIVMLHPFLYSIWQPQNILLDKLWSLGCVSIAAQLATFPLSTHYFHQFPSYFLFANFFAIPAAFVILIGGFIYWILYFVGFPWIYFFAELYEGVIWITNEMIFFFDGLPGSVVDGLFLEMSESLVLYTLVLLLGIGFAYRSFITVSSGLCLGILLLLSLHFRDFRQRQQQAYLFYDIKEGVAVDYVRGKHVDSYVSKEGMLASQFDFTIKPVRVGLGLPLELAENNSSSVWQHNELFSIHSSDSVSIALLHENPATYEFLERIPVDYLVISSRTLDDLSAISGKFDIGCLVLAADVPGYLVDKLQEQAEQLGIASYSLARQGMLKIELI